MIEVTVVREGKPQIRVVSQYKREDEHVLNLAVQHDYPTHESTGSRDIFVGLTRSDLLALRAAIDAALGGSDGVAGAVLEGVRSQHHSESGATGRVRRQGAVRRRVT